MRCCRYKFYAFKVSEKLPAGDWVKASDGFLMMESRMLRARAGSGGAIVNIVFTEQFTFPRFRKIFCTKWHDLALVFISCDSSNSEPMTKVSPAF